MTRQAGEVNGAAEAFQKEVSPIEHIRGMGSRFLNAIDGDDPEELGAASLPVAVAVVGVAAGKLGGSNAAGGFSSFRAFKRAMGPAGEGMQWHHVVEQTWWNVLRFGSKRIHNVKNIVPLEKGIHEQVSGYYSSKRRFTEGATVREWLRPQTFEAQFEFGLRVMQKFGGQP